MLFFSFFLLSLPLALLASARSLSLVLPFLSFLLPPNYRNSLWWQKPLEPDPLDARPDDAKRCRSGRGSLAERKPLTGRDGETKKTKEKKKKKNLRGAPNPRSRNLQIS